MAGPAIAGSLGGRLVTAAIASGVGGGSSSLAGKGVIFARISPEGSSSFIQIPQVRDTRGKDFSTFLRSLKGNDSPSPEPQPAYQPFLAQEIHALQESRSSAVLDPQEGSRVEIGPLTEIPPAPKTIRAEDVKPRTEISVLPQPLKRSEQVKQKPLDLHMLARVRATLSRLTATRGLAGASASSEISSTQASTQPKTESVPKIETAVGVKVTQAEKTEILTRLQTVNKRIRRDTTQNKQEELAVVQKAHDINKNRINSLDAAYEKIENEKGAVGRDELIKEAGFLGEMDESPLIAELGLNKKDGSKLRIVKGLDLIQIKRKEIPAIVLGNTALRLADKDAFDQVTDREIKNVLTLPDVLESPIDYERALRRVIVQGLKREAIVESASVHAPEIAEKVEDKTSTEKNVPRYIVAFPELNPFIGSGSILDTLDSMAHNIIGLKEREELLKVAA